MSLTAREKLFLVAAVIVVVLGVSLYLGKRDPQRKYYVNEKYCENDFDCTIVYDIVSAQPQCKTVNNLNRHRYDIDPICLQRKAYCRRNACILAN